MERGASCNRPQCKLMSHEEMYESDDCECYEVNGVSNATVDEETARSIVKAKLGR